MMEHATQFPGEYSKVAGVTAKVSDVSQKLTTSSVSVMNISCIIISSHSNLITTVCLRLIIRSMR